MTGPTPAPDPDTARVLEVKKYPNRRLYDATRSCHVTLGELYELVAAGHLVRVRDSKSGEDITNQVLLQALVERDPLKITAVPSPLIHMMIRMNQGLIASWFDLYVGQIMEAYRTASGSAGPSGWWGWPGGGTTWPGMPTGGAFRGWPAATGPSGPATSPMEWLTSLMQPPNAAAGTASPEPQEAEEAEAAPAEPGPAASGDVARDDELESLRRQVALLAEEMARLRPARRDSDE